MSTVTEIKSAIDRLSPAERAELERLMWPEWDQPGPAWETPPGVREKLAEAAQGHFYPGDPANAERILSSLK